MLTIAIAGTPEGAKNFIEALHALGAEGRSVLEETDFSGYDGLILPGGADIDPELFGEENWGCRRIDRPLDENQLNILDIFLKAGKPVLGVCKGHQLLNVYFGGTVYQHIPEYEIHQWIGDDDQAHGTRCEEGSFLHKLYGDTQIPVNSAHHQAVLSPASCFHMFQWADDGVPEGMIHTSLPIIGLQWHPERMCCSHHREDTVDGLPVFRYFLQLITGEEKLH